MTDQPVHAALYARVSTGRQAEADLSIPDQTRHAQDFCARRGFVLLETFVEPGASGMDEDRPAFQRMIDRATGPDRPFRVILVHSLSRFFRDAMFAEFYTRRLRNAGVQLLSMTQEFADDPTGEVVRKVLNVFDEYQSRENAKHTHRAMLENTRQGFWNGSRPPFGYHTVAAGQRGHKVKKVLAIDEAEAPIVRRIFGLVQGEEGIPLGVKAIASRLNAESIRFRGKPFAISNVHRILTSETYAGTHWFNVRDSRMRQDRPREQWVSLQVPALVDHDTFLFVQRHLAARNPRVAPPRVTSGPTLLTGIVRCEACGAGMTLRTGKSGRYRYYACAGRAQKGNLQCSGCSMPMDRLDEIVLDQLARRVFAPDRLPDLLAGWLAQSRDADAEREQRRARRRAELTEVEGAHRRLLDAIEKGLVDLDDPMLRERLAQLRAQRTALQEELALAGGRSANPPAPLTQERLERLSLALTEQLRLGPPEARRQYVRLFVERVTVRRDRITITGPKAALAHAAAAIATGSKPVPSFVREWRP